jgi:hypothetical protein
MKTRNMVELKLSEFLRRHIWLTSYRVHHLCQLVNEDTTLSFPRLVLGNLTIKSKAAVWQGFSKTGNV